MAFNGFRGDYTTSDVCAELPSGTAGTPAASTTEWAETEHAEAGADEPGTALSVRLRYAKAATRRTSTRTKVVPTPTATDATLPVPSTWAWPPTRLATEAQTVGNAASSENYVGCSSCHYGANVGGSLAVDGVDPNDTAHTAPLGKLANADICGQCHSRYSYTVDTFPVTPIPYGRLDGVGHPIPNPTPTSLLQPQNALGYPMLGRRPRRTGWDPARR